MTTPEILYNVFNAVSTATGVTYDEFSCKSRLRRVVTARTVFAYVCVKGFGAEGSSTRKKITFARLGDFMGRKHSTVIHCLKKAEDYLDTEKEFVELVDSVGSAVGITRLRRKPYGTATNNEKH